MFRVCLCFTVLSAHCYLEITCLERVDLLDLFCVMFSCVFVTFRFGVPSKVWYLIVLILIFAVFLTRSETSMSNTQTISFMARTVNTFLMEGVDIWYNNVHSKEASHCQYDLGAKVTFRLIMPKPYFIF